MIGFVRGRLVGKLPPQLVIEAGGIGYELDAPMTTFYRLPEIGREVMLHTHLVIREDAHVLYGFATERERRLFRELIRVSGVGPRIALALLSGISVERFLECLESEDADTLVRVPGIGRKTAERLIVEMRDRAAVFGPVAQGRAAGDGSVESRGPHAEAFSALVALGYKPAEVTRMLNAIDATDATTEDLIRQALKSVAKD
jgi:Holliday junction DNA helicase RuvA